ncbi:MAG: hypothetical protein AAF548_18990, partial [Actinomycetota bacterium]
MDEVRRTRLLPSLRERWQRPLVVVRARAGAGKSTLLRQAIDENRRDPRGHDLVHRCRPGDADASRLAAALATLFDIELDPEAAGGAAIDLADHVAGRAPQAVSLHLDDAHLISPDSTGGELVRRLYEERPTNLSFVLATRGETPVPLARAIAQDEASVLDGDADLFFDADELALLDAERTIDDAYGGWPAMVALAHRAPRSVAADFLAEEVVQTLRPPVRRALQVLGTAGPSTPEALLGNGVDREAIAELRTLPLVDEPEPGVLRAHDLWSTALHDLEDAVDVDHLSLLLGEGDHDAALAFATSTADRTRVLLEALRAELPAFPNDRAERWFGGLPADERRAPAGQLLALAGRIETDDLPNTQALAAHFGAEGERDAQLTALGVGVYLAYEAGDMMRVLTLRHEIDAVDHPLPAFLQACIAVTDAVTADLAGDARRAVDVLNDADFDAATPRLREQMVRLWATNLVSLGCAGDALAVAGAELGRSDNPQVAATPRAIAWFAGDPGPVLETASDARVRRNPGAEAMLADAYLQHYLAALGTPTPTEVLDRAPQPLGLPRADVMVAVAAAASRVAAGREREAAELLARTIEAQPADPVVELELRRFPAIARILTPETFDIEAALASGPDHRRVLDAAEAFVRAREDDARGWADAFDAPTLLTALPLRWTVELLCRGAAHDAGWTVETTIDLAQLLGPPVRDALERAAAADEGALGKGATALLATTPVPPDQPVRVELLGPFHVTRGGADVDDDLARRVRVQQLIGLLLLGGPLTRDQLVEMLWPDHEPTKALRNLRTNLSHVRRLLEPDLPSRSPSYFVRTAGDRIWLAGDALDNDVDDFERAVAAATAADDDGRLDDALEAYVHAVELFRSPGLGGLADLDRLA